MGRANLSDMLEHVSKETAMEWHLAYNHYPPVPQVMAGPCWEAIGLLQDDKPNAMVALPEGIAYRGQTEIAVWELVEALHLDEFVFGDAS